MKNKTDRLIQPEYGHEEENESKITKEDQYGLLLVVLLLFVMITLGVIIKDRVSQRVWDFTSREAGIEVQYPAGWFSSEQGDYVAQFRNPMARPFKTQYTIRVAPFGPQSSVRNVLDSLTIQRSSDLSAYRVLNIEEITQEGLVLTQMDFVYVDADPNPFIQKVPVVVQGRDIVIVDNDRAIVITFMSDQDDFDQNLMAFDQFFSSMRY